MFTANTPPSSMMLWVVDDRFAHTRTSGGSADTLENAETVIPCNLSPLRDVTTVTPLAQPRRALLNSD
jgi:hypothetical protein